MQELTDWYHVHVESNTVFLPKVRQWLEQKVGCHDLDWAWSYRWVNNTYTDDSLGQGCQLTVAFANARWATVFELAWSEVCV